MRAARPGPAVARAAVAAASAAGCCRLFGGAGWVVPVVLAVAGALATGALTDHRSPRPGGAFQVRSRFRGIVPGKRARTQSWEPGGRRRSIGVVASAHAAGLALLLAETVGRHTAYGLPTPGTLAALWRAARQSPDALRAAIVPAPVSPELLLWVVAGLWVATAVADGLARRSRARLAAVLPLAVFPVVVAALGTARGRAPLTFAFAAAVAFYAAATRDAALPAPDARVLGPGRPGGRPLFLSSGSPLGALRPVRERRRAGPGTIGLAGPVLVWGLAAVLLGPLVPGVGGAVVDVHALGVTVDLSRVELNPLVDIRPQLLTARRTELFTVRATAPAYWRLTALDRFDGRLWSPSRPALLRRHGPSAFGAADGDRALAQDVQVSALDSPWLPAADRAIRVTATGARLDPETDSLVTRKGSRAVGAYRVESRLPVDRSDQRPPAEGHPAAPAAEHRPDVGRYLALPPRFPPEVRELAEHLTAGAATPFDRAVALEDSLRVGFIYDETAPPGASVDALEEFLFRSRRGYCEQFAGAYAAMARSLGLPARVAVGFTPGTWDESNGLWRVTTREAHAWPEVFLDGIGWTAFEPTPGRVLPDPETRMRPPRDLSRVAAARQPIVRGDAPVLTRVEPGAPTGRDAGPGGRPGGLAHAVGHWSPAWLGLALFGLVFVPPAAKQRRRRARRRTAGDAAVLGAWRETLDRLSEVRVSARSDETPLEFAARAGAARPGAARPLRHLAGLVNVAAYGPGATSAPSDAWAAADSVTRALDAHDPPTVRLRRRLDPRPLLRR